MKEMEAVFRGSLLFCNPALSHIRTRAPVLVPKPVIICIGNEHLRTIDFCEPPDNQWFIHWYAFACTKA